MRLGCLRVVAGLDGHCHVSLRVYTLDIIKNKIKQLLAIVVLVGTPPPLSSWTAMIIAQYPVLRTVQSPLHFTTLTDLFTQTPSRLLWEASSHMLQLMCEGCSYTYPPLSL